MKRLLTGTAQHALMQSTPGSLDNQITVYGCIDEMSALYFF
jgi:hypothetical protein